MGLDLKRVKSIADSLLFQFDDPESNPIMIQVSVPDEDYEFMLANRTMIYACMEFNDDCSILMAYMMVKLAFEKYDNKFWDHYKDFISPCKYNRNYVVDRIFDVLLTNGYAPQKYYSGRNLIVDIILFNAGIPLHQANVFFDKVYSYYVDYHGELNDKGIGIINQRLMLDYQKNDYSYNGIHTVRDFLRDDEYSSELIKNTLLKMDDPDGGGIDLGLLEDAFNTWYQKDRLRNKSSGSCKLGLFLNINNSELYLSLPPQESEERTYGISIEPQPEFDYPSNIPTIPNNGRFKTVEQKIGLEEYNILNGLKLSHNDLVLIDQPRSNYLLFDKNGNNKKQLSNGTNWIVAPYDLVIEDIPITEIIEKDEYCIHKTAELNKGDTYQINNQLLSVGSTDYQTSKIDGSKIDYVMRYQSKLIHGYYEHPIIECSFKTNHVSMEILDQNGHQICYETKIINGTYRVDLAENPNLKSFNGIFTVKIRSGSKLISYSYVRLSDFRVSIITDDMAGPGKIKITANRREEFIEYSEKQKAITHDIRFGMGVAVECDLQTPVLAYQIRPSDNIWMFPMEDDNIKSSDINPKLVVSYGNGDGKLCRLQFISSGKRVIGDNYAIVRKGKCDFRIPHVNDLYSFKNYIDVIFVDENDNKHQLLTLNCIPKVEIDNKIAGICLFTMTSQISGHDITIMTVIDGKESRFRLFLNRPAATTYVSSLEYKVIDSYKGEEITISSGKLSFGKNNKIAKKEFEEIKQLADSGDAPSQTIIGRELRYKNDYNGSLTYLAKACESGYAPAFDEMALLLLNHEYGFEKALPFIKKAVENNSSRMKLLYDVERLKHPELEPINQVDDSS